MLSLIKRHEGLASKDKNKTILITEYKPETTVYPYICPGGVLTIGWGNAINKNNIPQFKQGITVTECEELLIQHVNKILKNLERENFFNKCSENQKEAIISLIYNIGIGNFRTSSLYKELQKSHWNEKMIKHTWQMWCYIGKNKSHGLLKRRIEESNLFCKDIRIKIHNNHIGFQNHFATWGREIMNDLKVFLIG